MTSRRIENVHLDLLDKLLADSGLECLRTPSVCPESTSSSGTPEEQGKEEQEEEALPESLEEEKTQSVIEEVLEALPDIFPTPSLRLVLSDKVRKLEKHNRIHVLPEEFKFKIDPQAIPRILTTPQQEYIEILADMVGCDRYKSSLAEFWFLDTMANLLRRAQEDELARSTQAILMMWFCEWMKEMQYFDAADRNRMLRRFKDNMTAAANYIAVKHHLPTPEQAGVFYKSPEDTLSSKASSVKIKSKPSQVHFGDDGFECAMRDLVKILHYIFDLFSSDYQYDLIRSVFTFTPDYALIDAPYQIQNPKRLYVPLKIKPKKPEKPKKDKPAKGGKGKKEIEVPEEYLALMQRKALEEKILEEAEEKDREAWQFKSRILPLNLAATEEFFNLYWPPPPPELEPEPIPVVEVKGKGKAKGKK